MRPSRLVRRPLGISLSRFTSAIAALTAIAGTNASAATNTFTGPGTIWNDLANWSGGAIPGLTDALLLDATSPLVSTLENSFTSQTLAFDIGAGVVSIDANASGTTGRTLTLNGGTNALGGTELLSLSATTTGTVNIGATAGVGTLTLALGATSTFNVQNSAATLNFGANSVIGGAFSLTKAGAGTLTLAGTNTFGGAGLSFTLSAGTLNLNSPGALGNANNAFIVNGGTINNTSAGPVAMTARPMTVGGNFAFTGTQNLDLGTGAVTLTGSRQITVDAGTLTLGGNIGGATFNLTKAGAGALALNGVIGTTTGGLNVNGGTLIVGNAANTFTGNITVDGASSVLQLTSGANGNASSAPLGIKSGGTSYKTVTLSNGGAFRPMATYNVNTPTGTAAGAGQVYIMGTGGGVLDIPSGVLMTMDDGSGAGTATTNAQLQGSGTLTKIGAGTLSLGNGTSNFSSFTGQIFINEGTLATGSGTFQLGDAVANTVVASGATLDVRNVLSAEPITLNGTGVGSNGALITSTGTGTVPGTITVNADSSFGGAGTLNITGTVNNGSLNLTKVGAGTTTFSGSVSGNGVIAVNAGGLGASNAGATNTITALGASPVTMNAGTLFLKANGSASNQIITFTNPVTIAGTATIDVNRVGANSGGAMSLSNVTLNSGSTLNVTGGNNYSLLVTNPITLSGTTTLNPTTSALNLTGRIDDAGQSLVVSGTGSTRLLNTATGVNSNALSSTITVNGGNLLGFAQAADAVVASSNSLGTATIALTGTNPVLRLAPNLAGGLNTVPVAGLIDKSYTGITSLGATNFLGSTQPITTGTGGQNPTGTQTVSQINIPSAATATTSSHQYTGLINITTAGNYIFQAFTDDGGALSIDGNAPISTANTTVTSAIYLTAGLHTISSRWNNNSGNGGDVVSYQGPDTANAMIVVPASAFSNASTAQLTTNFGNNITFAATSNSTIETASSTTVGSLTMTGTGAGTTLNINGTGDINTVTAGALTVTDSLTFNNPTAHVTLNGGVATSGGTNFNFTKSGFGTLTVKGAFAPTGLLTVNAGQLTLANDGTGSNGTINQGNNVLIGGNNVTLDVRSNGGGNTGNTVAFGTLSTPSTATVTTTTLSSGDGYKMSFTGLALTGTTGNNTTLIANTDVTISGNVTSQMSGFGTGNFDTLLLSGTSTGSAILGSIGEAGTFTPLTGGYTRIIKQGAGTWTLSGANTYTGITQVQAGTLKQGANSVIGALNLQGVDVTATGAGVTATYDFAGFNQTLNTVSGTGNALNLGGSTATSTPVISGTGSTVTINGNVNYVATNNPLGGTISIGTLDLNSGNRTFAVGDSSSAAIDLAVSSVVQNGTITKTGAGTLRLSTPGNNLTLALTAGTVDLGGATHGFTLTPTSSGSLQNGAITATSLLKQGPGTLNFGVTGASVTSVTVNQGLLSTTSSPATPSALNFNFAAVGAPTTNLVGATTTLTLGGSATALIGGGAFAVTGAAAGANGQTFASTTFDGGANGVAATIGAGGTAFVNLGTVTRNTKGTVDFVLPAGTQSSTNGITLANPGTAGTLLTDANGTAYGTVSGNDWAANSTDSAGNIVGASVAGATGASIYTTSNSAATFIGNADITGAFTATSGSTVNSIRFNSGAITLTLAGTNTITSGGVLFGSGTSGASIITGGTIVPGAGNELVFINNRGNTAPQINSIIGNGAGATTVTYRGNPNGTVGGLFQVGANNSYTGPTYITSGRVQVASGITAPFGTGANAIVYVDGNADGQFFSGQNVTIANPFVIVGTGFNESGTRRGAIRLDSTSSITPTLSGTITLVGDATIGNNAAISGTGTAVLSGNILTSNAQGATSFALTKTGTGQIRLSGTNNQTATNLNAGALRIGADAPLGITSAPLNFGGGTLAFDSATTLPNTRSLVAPSGITATFDTNDTATGAVTTINGVISGAGNVTKSYIAQGFDTNPLVLAGQNTFTGNVTATSGWIVATNSASFGVGTKTISAQTNLSSDSIHLDSGVGGVIDFPATISFATSNDTFTGANEGTITNDSGDNIIRGNVSMTSGGGGTILASKAGSINFTGTISPSTTGRNLKVRGDGAGIISGIVANASTPDMPVLRDLGSGTWTFSGANTYTGLTSVNAGTLKLGHVSALGGLNTVSMTSDNGTTVSSGAALDLGGQTNVNEVIRISGTGIGNAGALINTGAAATIGASLANLRAVGTTGITISGATSVTFAGGGAGSGAAATATLGVTAANFAISGGTTTYSAAPTVTIGGGTGATATATLTGNVVTGITITNAGSGFTGAPTITFSGGTVLVAGTNPTGTGNNTNFALTGLTITNAGSGYTAPLTATIANTSGANAALTATASGVTLTGNSNIGGTGDITVNSFISESGGSFGVTKVGSNSLILNGTNSYTGATTVRDGELLVAGALSGSSLVTVTDDSIAAGSGGLLGGGGSVGNVVLTATTAGSTAGGTLNPGNILGAAGTLNVGTGTGTGLNIGAGSRLSLDLGGAGIGQYDRVNVAAGSSINIAGNVTGTLFNGYQPVGSDLLFVLLNNGGGITGTFANQFSLNGQDAVNIGGSDFYISYTANFIADGNVGNSFTGGDDIALLAVPEPTSALSLLGGLGVLMAGRRRRRNA